MLNGANSVLLYGFSGDRCDVLYDSREPDQSEVRTVVISALLRTQKERSSEVSRGAPASSREGHLSSSALDSALTIALCRIQRLKREKICSNPRVLCIQASQDSPRQYVPTMNAIFAAQRAMVPIDVCVLGTAESSLLQQASFLSGGVYQNIAYPGGLLQYLISVFAIGPPYHPPLRECSHLVVATLGLTSPCARWPLQICIQGRTFTCHSRGVWTLGHLVFAIRRRSMSDSYAGAKQTPYQ
eukprot:scaffold744_cov370-Prasinococcus_capsulatus_cf.AAC.10